MSAPSYDLYDIGEGLPYRVLSIEDYWVSDSGIRHADCTIDLDGKPGYWCSPVTDLVYERVAA